MLVSVSFVLAVPTQRPPSSLAPLLIGEPLNNSAVSDVKGIALIPGLQVNVGSLLLH